VSDRDRDDESATRRPRHSEDWFGDWRDHWWHRDYLALIVRRWDLGDAHRVLDVGCGVGHWGRALMPHLPATTHLVGIDREPTWVDEAAARARAAGLEGRASYVVGTAEALPLAPARLDVVTCQTGIMRLPDPARGIAEMQRVLAPGGRIVVAEPNNLATAAARLAAEPFEDDGDPIPEQLALLELELRAERGKRRLGQGFNSLGERIPGLFAAAGLVAIEAYASDKVFPFVPPYTSPDEQARIAEWRELVARQLWIAPREEARAYWIAGGGDPSAFEARWALMMRAQARVHAALSAGVYAATGGSGFYLVGAIKPRAA